ncbi:hypothetical protein EJ04DRAFT_96314 [Polyplosphaeria fusca]|uniref:Uncharacterized protein n=1 Tax=Polyplosphaeria fusca TaxID=682080 RepID=A0A9P4QJN8_9PLEO|nr:hypothetical protein EJ04DRAFT_96314 [Polyplosphaeria fusca]
MQRQRQLPLSATEAWERLESTLSRPMNGRNIKTRVNDAKDILDEVPVGTKRKRHQIFLFEFLRKCGPAFVVLCAIGLGQAQIASMNATSRPSLLGTLEKKQGITLIGKLESLIPTRLKAMQHLVPDRLRGVEASIIFISVPQCDCPYSRPIFLLAFSNS